MKYDVFGFEKIATVRFSKDQVKDIRRIVKHDHFTYPSISVFIRSSVIRRVREEKKRLKL